MLSDHSTQCNEKNSIPAPCENVISMNPYWGMDIVQNAVKSSLRAISISAAHTNPQMKTVREVKEKYGARV
ncbi:hypothetical protein DSCO28_68340 [Desulfosarcina ovata subsp. sediminis]|uniref:Uncharacterized protein n=2 Tax=Desulfosarcina ovata TaxID=83564 RepID=A0A5K8AKI7_9BACT|nr:hypothetical protein DSCO28_68340 [Desulfosarcina ovata subsp. sediminis]BBO93222.1 hypothetical protein DSCOOX_64020 [Desulfosarcina ovata subsp. ovata]